jgi:hypothetical protein
MAPDTHPAEDLPHSSALIGPRQAEAINAAGLHSLRPAAEQLLVNALANRRTCRAPNRSHGQPGNGATN